MDNNNTVILDISFAKPLCSGMMDISKASHEKPKDMEDFIEKNTIGQIKLNDKESN